MNYTTTVLCLFAPFAFAAAPRDSVPPDAPDLPRDFRLHVEFSGPQGGAVRLGGLAVPLSNGAEHDVAVEHPAKGAPVLRVWTDGKLVRGPEEIVALAEGGAREFPDAGLDLGGDFTAAVTFDSGAGSLFSMCPPKGKWAPSAKVLYIDNGKLIYDIGGLGKLTGGPKVNNGKRHTAVLTTSGGVARLWLDGKAVAEKPTSQNRM